ncbi:uncharacterized protein LOC143025919 [Oratosquilla oratoria]|uniref:uncharacterized protein LOC143025919 n=1 Tax=Oratosquilla oratoria TaxID=337810 RepID=UPI003F76A715
MCGDVLKLIRRRNANEEPIYFAKLEDTYDTIKRAHIATGHGDRDKMVKEVTKKYANITHDAISIYKSLCIECQRKRKRPTTKGTVVRPILTKNFGSRSQVDLVDMQSMKQGNYKWIMVYQDHLTKFCVLRPLTSKRAAEVAYQLLDIFLLLGAPEILQSDNGSEFTASVITELKLLWPDLVMVHGKPRHPQSQGSVERANFEPPAVKPPFESTSVEPPSVKPPSVEPPAVEPPVEPTSVEPPAVEPPSIEPPTVEPPVEPTYVEPPSVEPPAVEPPVEPTSVEPPSVKPTSVEPTSSLSVRQNNIISQRKRAYEAKLSQAERMVKRSRRIMDRGNVENNVTIPIPMVDRSRGDPRNIMEMIVDIDENDNYTIAVQSGILSGKYTRNQFDLCMYELYSEDDVTTDRIVSLRSAVQQESNSGGQGFAKCNCAGSKRCQTNRCKCFKLKVKCNSRCHSSLHCENKVIL